MDIPDCWILRGSIRSSYSPSPGVASTEKVTRLACGVMLPQAMCHLFGLHNNKSMLNSHKERKRGQEGRIRNYSQGGITCFFGELD